jgi:DNA-binding NarL/FixJ family response regulator
MGHYERVTTGEHPGGLGTPRPVRVLIVDDHEVFATSLSMVLEQEPDIVPVGLAGSIRAAAELLASATPDVVLLDNRLPDGEGVAAIRALREQRPGVQVVMLTASTSDHVLAAAMEAGAAGFVAKTRSLDEVVTAVRAAATGDAVITPALLSRLLPRLRRQHEGVGHDLTAREREVLGLLADGMTNAAIAEHLFVSVHTVRNHIANLSAKLGAHSKLEALSIAVREGLLPGL